MLESATDDLGRLARRILGPVDGDLVVGLARPAIRLDRRLEPVGRSRLGGVPLLEPEQDWPRWGDRSLSFLALLDMAAFAGRDVGIELPPRGLVNFFYEADEQMAWGSEQDHVDGWRVVVADPRAAAERQRPGDALQFTECPLGQRPILTLPDPFESVVEDLENRCGDALVDLVEQWRELIGVDVPNHQLGGWPLLVQNPMQMECQLASNGIPSANVDPYKDPAFEHVRRGADAWRLILQLDSDDDAGWMWGDVGTLYYNINGSVADAASLAAAWMVFQCC